MNKASVQHKIRRLYDALKSAHKETEAKKVIDLAQKSARGEYGIAFCGHFSAGKSRMINTIIGALLLPSSPIPTSANLVRIQKGEDYAEVRFREGKRRRYLAPYDYDMIKSYAKDGDAILGITLSSAGIDLPEGVVLFDTPGIDSSDPMHRKATEDAIHLADLVCYVMDYNHVQAEESFRFTKSLTDAGREVVLVINQVDKHRDAELSFDEFRAGLETAFQSWGVKPAAMFCTSMRESDHPHNEYRELEAYLKDAMAGREDRFAASLVASLTGIIDDVEAEEEKEDRERLAEEESVIAHLSPSEREDLITDFSALMAEEDSLRSDLKEEFTQRFENILAHAYMMTYEERELAKSYIEAADPSFKVGFFGRGKKTEAEMERRRAALWEAFGTKVQAQIDWHVATFVKEFARTHGVDIALIQAEADAFTAMLEPAAAKACLKEGADINNSEYIQSYSASLETETKKEGRRRIAPVFEKLRAAIEEKREQRLAAIREEMAGLSDQMDAIRAIAQAERERRKRRRALLAELETQRGDQEPVTGDDIFVLPKFDVEIIQGGIDEDDRAENGGTDDISVSSMNAGRDTDVNGDVTAQGSSSASDEQEGRDADEILHAWAPRLRRAAASMEGISPLRNLADTLMRRADRIDKRRYMVALFGAFSAGKSSFANALLGDAMLPVSPNPTTAAINKILPVDEAHPAGTARVRLKSEAMLLADLNRALAAFDEEAKALDEVEALAEKLTAGDSASAHASFLRAYLKGKDTFREKLGTTLTLTQTEFPAYASEEAKSCFVEEIDIYVDTPLSRRGIVLVDTPGADSVNARHTEAAFRFIKESDAILFVTYYNHAFSQADSDFLRQLGRVKDAFSMDKMFFIVNAIDLAEDAAEAEDVIGYVRQNLLRFGVAKPRLYGLSSQELLQRKQSGDTDPDPFETAFYDFIFRELTGIVLRRVEDDFEEAKAFLDHLIAESETGESEKAARLAAVDADEKAVEAIVLQKTEDVLLGQLAARRKELVYYIEERVFLRFEDMYRHAFNAATLGQGAGRRELLTAMEELLTEVGFTLAEEMRALTLRLEQFAVDRLRDFSHDVEREVREIARDFHVIETKRAMEGEVSYAPAYAGKSAKDYDRELALFKSPKQFFEGGGSRILLDALHKHMREDARDYLAREGERTGAYIEKGARTLFAETLGSLCALLADHFISHREVLEGRVSSEKLKEIRAGLQSTDNGINP
ncbi:dynamin family protein [Selenomonas sp. TAMA-11512]|uniref:dynamin family protein n=1 Tax=Selenomonas sp. TAMA-11512 TaxID=3095337 RepID=UPI00308D4A95|nr:dynamin family protein [Selenomonas sp. TAMA-11512]